MGIFISPHQTLFSVISSLTMYLSLGDLPVNFPVFTAKTLLFVKHPKFFFKQIEYNSSFVRL